MSSSPTAIPTVTIVASITAITIDTHILSTRRTHPTELVSWV
jgi:hypothetical protein